MGPISYQVRFMRLPVDSKSLADAFWGFGKSGTVYHLLAHEEHFHAALTLYLERTTLLE